MLWRSGAGRQVDAGVGILLAGALVLAVSAIAEGEVAEFAGAFGNVAPFVLLAVLAQLQPVWPTLRPLEHVGGDRRPHPLRPGPVPGHRRRNRVAPVPGRAGSDYR